ncbi:MAG TPA: hypothetical protein DCR70_07620 [Phycisphaerales bacterium]|nr:hypothetical protein [Phycisphaerales bacterium]
MMNSAPPCGADATWLPMNAPMAADSPSQSLTALLDSLWKQATAKAAGAPSGTQMLMECRNSCASLSRLRASLLDQTA